MSSKRLPFCLLTSAESLHGSQDEASFIELQSHSYTCSFVANHSSNCLLTGFVMQPVPQASDTAAVLTENFVEHWQSSEVYVHRQHKTCNV